MAALIGAFTSPLLATDLYVSQVRGCGLIFPCSPSLDFYRIDLERTEATRLRSGLPAYTSVTGFDAAQPRVLISSSFEQLPCCNTMWVDLASSPLPGTPRSPDLPFTYPIFDSGRVFAIRLTDVVELDVATGAATQVMPLGMLAQPLALDLAHGRLYILARPNDKDRELRVVDLTRKTVSGPLMPVRQAVAVVTDRDGTAYVFDGPYLFGVANVFRLDAGTNELTTFAGDLLITAQGLVLDPVDRRQFIPRMARDHRKHRASAAHVPRWFR